MAVPGTEAGSGLRIIEQAPVGRSALSFALGAAATAALIPAFLLLDPTSRWTPPALVLVLACVALISYFGALVVDRTALLDAAGVVALVALAYLGPLPAACIWIATEAAAFSLEKVNPSAFLANVASYGWAAIAAGLLLATLAGDPPLGHATVAQLGAIALAGIVMQAVNFAITRGLVSVVRNGRSLTLTMRTELVAALPVTLLMTAIGTVTAFLYAEIGLIALALFSLIVVVPQLLVSALVRRRQVSELEHSAAVELYAQAIADALGLDRKSRAVLRDGAHFIRERPLCPRDGELSRTTTGHRLAVVEAVLYYREHWDGRGGVPGGIGGEMIPLASRILAVADAWSGVTAKGSPLLSHSQALNQLKARAGMHFDPLVVAAAISVVQEERLAVPGEVAYQPVLYRLRLPRAARRLGARITGLAGRPAAA